MSYFYRKKYFCLKNFKSSAVILYFLVNSPEHICHSEFVIWENNLKKVICGEFFLVITQSRVQTQLLCEKRTDKQFSNIWSLSSADGCCKLCSCPSLKKIQIMYLAK